MSETKTKIPKTATTNDSWFNKFIKETVHGIRVDELQLKTNTADEVKVKVYDSLQSGDTDAVIDTYRDLLFKHYVSTITKSYISEVMPLIVTNMPIKLAFRLTNSKILVWAEIKDDDESCENALIIAEAKINAKFSEKGFHISSTIVEESDRLTLPPHYADILQVLKS